MKRSRTFKAIIFLGIVQIILTTASFCDDEANLLQFFVNTYPSSQRIVLKLSALPNYTVDQKTSVVEVDLVNTTHNDVNPPELPSDSIIDKINVVQKADNNLLFEFILLSDATVSHFTIESSGLIIVDIAEKDKRYVGGFPTESDKTSRLKVEVASSTPSPSQLSSPGGGMTQYLPGFIDFASLPTPDLTISALGTEVSEAIPMQSSSVEFDPSTGKRVVSYEGIELVDDFPMGLLSKSEGNLKGIYTDFRTKNYMTCLENLTSFLSTNPLTKYGEEMLFMRAECLYQYARIGQSHSYIEATNAFRLAMRIFPESLFEPYALLRLSQSYFHMKMYLEAVGVVELSESRLTSGYDAQMLFYKAESAFNSGRLKESQKAFERLLSDFPDTDKAVQSTYRLGEICFLNKEKVSAYDWFKKGKELSQTYPENKPELLFAIGQTARVNERFAEAREFFKIIRDRFPGTELAYKAMDHTGLSYYEQRRFMTEKGNVARAQEARRNMVNAYVEFIEQCPDGEKTISAMIHVAEIGIEDEEDDLVDKKIRGRDYGSPDAYLFPLDTLEGILNDYPNNELAQVSGAKLGDYYADRGQVDKAIQIFGELLNRYPESKLRGILRGFIQDKFAETVKRRYVEGDYVGAVMIYKSNKSNLGESDVDNFSESKLDNKSLFYLGDSYYKLHFYKNALDVFEKVISNYDPLRDYNDIEIEYIYYIAAKIYSLLGEGKKAIHISGLLRNEFPGSEYDDKALLLLSGELVKAGQYVPALNHLNLLSNTKTLSVKEKIDAMILSADCYRKLADVPQALSCHGEALLLFSTGGEDFRSSEQGKEILFRLANILYANRDFERASKALKYIEEFYPDDADMPFVFYKIGRSEIEIGHPDVAKDYLAKANKVAAADSLVAKMSTDALEEIEWSDAHKDIVE